MRCVWTRVFYVGCAFVGLVACSEIAPTNPYDPATPVPQQAKAMITGQVSLPTEETDLAVFDAGRVFLVPTNQGAASRV